MTSKSWTVKFNKGDTHKGIKKTNKGKMYISSPQEIADILKLIPKGKLTTTKDIAQLLAQRNNADFTCPMTTGIFLSIVANYYEEQKGKIAQIPYWRVVKQHGRLYPKYLGKTLPQKEYLLKENFEIVPNKNHKEPLEVKDWQKYLYDFTK